MAALLWVTLVTCHPLVTPGTMVTRTPSGIVSVRDGELGVETAAILPDEMMINTVSSRYFEDGCGFAIFINAIIHH